MKKLLLYFVASILMLAHGYSQSKVILPNKVYTDMKVQGLLKSGVEYVIINESKTEDFKTSPISNTHINRLPQKSPDRSPVSCSCVVPLDNTFQIAPFTIGTAPDYRNDDGSTPAITLPFSFCLYGTSYNQVYINNNGNVTFNHGVASYSAVGFPAGSVANPDTIMIAPFWADVDTEAPSSGLVYYKVTPGYIIVKWDGVGYFNDMVDKVNTFQLIITDGTDPILPIGNNVAFCYGDMQWTTGSASGGTGGFGGKAATAGMNRGDGINYLQLGRFDQAGMAYDGGYGLNDGVSWLDDKTFYFNSCSSTNFAPIASGLNNCDTIKLCSTGDTLILNGLFLAPEIGQTTTISVNLNGTQDATILSNTSGNSANALIQIIGSLANAGSNTITFIATDDGTPVGTTIVNVNVFVDTTGISNFHPVISGNMAFCEGDSSQLSVSPTTYDSYYWSTGSTTPSTYVFSSGQYWLTSVMNGCSKSNIVDVVTHPLPTPVVKGDHFAACNTGVSTLFPDSLIYVSYLWSNNNTNDSVTVGPGTYSLHVTDNYGCSATSAPMTVVLPQTPIITAHNDTMLCSGETVNLSVSFSGSPAPTSCGLSTSGNCNGTGSPITIGNGVSTNTSSGYPAFYANFWKSSRQQFLFLATELIAAGISPGKIDQLDFNVTTINGISLYNDYTINMGCTNQISISTFQSGLLNVYTPKIHNVIAGWNAHVFDNTFEWDGISNVIVEICMDNTANSTYTNNCQSPYTPTTFVSCVYHYEDTNPSCSVTTTNGTSSDRPNIRFHNCTGIQNPADFTYLWTPTSGNIANQTSQVTTAQPPGAITFTVLVNGTNGGCQVMDSVQVGIININTLTISPAGPYCVNGSKDTLQVSVPTGLGVWSGPGITNPNLGIFDPAIATAGTTHQIIYTINSNCGTGTDTINIIVLPLPDASITPVPIQCSTGSPITLTAATPGGTWSGTGITNATTGTFDPSLAGVGSDTIKYTLTTPCTSVDTVIIQILHQSDATITHVGPLCSSVAAFTLTSIDPGGQWTGTGITNGITGVFDPAVAGVGSHEIIYTISGVCGAIDTDTIVIVAAPVSSFTQDTTQGCQPTTISITGITNQPGGISLWNFGDGGTSAALNPVHTYQTDNNGIPYDVSFTYTNTTGCSTTSTINALIMIHSQPVAIYTASPQPTTIIDPTIYFTDLSTGLVDSWTWSFGAAATTQLQNPTHTYPDTGTYAVELIVKNIFGCVDTTFGSVIIDPLFVLYAPNAFTPNGNGINDKFLIKGEGISLNNFEISIYDRWGKIVYKSSDPFEGWNGKMNNTGVLVEEDVYVWRVNLKDYSKIPHSYKGHVTIVK